MADIKAQWQDWSARFAALQKREKVMVSGALAVAILFGGFTLWVEPALLQKTRLTKSLSQQQTEQTELQTQVSALLAQVGDPDAGNRALLAQLQKQLAEVEGEIQTFDKALVNPAQAPALLQTLLGRHCGLSLVSLNTLPRQMLITPPADDGKGAGQKAAQTTTQTTAQSTAQTTTQSPTPAPGATPAAPAGAATSAPPLAMPGGNIYKHGIEIKIAGGYHDLLAYVQELEQGPQRLMRGAMSLQARYPNSVLTLTVYTLSLEATWLVV